MRYLNTATVLLLLFASLAMADVTETQEFSYQISESGRLSLENVNGDIFIVGGEGDEVLIKAHKKANNQETLDKIDIIITADADHIRIETKHPKSSGWHWSKSSKGSVRYELSVPSGIELNTIETVNGSVDIGGMDSVVKAETVNGDLNINGLSADVNLETVNGSIKAEFDVLGDGQRVSADTVNGKIVFRLPADASARVSAETVNGSIDCDDFGLKASKGFVGKDLHGEIGGGAARLSLDTVNGSIKIVQK